MSIATPQANRLVVNLSDADNFIRQKIIINKVSIESLKTQIEYCKDVIRLQYLSSKVAEQKIVLAEKINTLLEEQLKEFTAERQEQFTKLYEEMNALDRPTEQQLKIISALETNKDKMLDLVHKVASMEENMPATYTVTNTRAVYSTQPHGTPEYVAGSNSCGNATHLPDTEYSD